jgi:hypothetical protein
MGLPVKLKRERPSHLVIELACQGDDLLGLFDYGLGHPWCIMESKGFILEIRIP